MTAVAQSLITIVLFLFMLGVLVVIHELGHFVTARLANIRVLEFGNRLPPRARVLRSGGETLYTLNWLPIGGFVKLEGEDGDGADDPRSFSAQRLGTKLWVLVAGVLMNLLLAFVIFAGIAIAGDPTMGVRIATVQPDSPAASAGIQAGDLLVALDGTAYGAFDGGSIIDDLRSHAGQTVQVGIERADASRATVTVTLRDAAAAADHGALGVEGLRAVVASDVLHHDLPTALRLGLIGTASAVGLIVGGLGSLIGSIATNPTAAPPASGPVGIALTVGDVFWQLGPVFTLYLAGALSANLAVVNILPLPPFDGGRMLMLVLKRVFGPRISLRAEQLTYVVGFVFLFAFLIWITGFDIARRLGGS